MFDFKFFRRKRMQGKFTAVSVSPDERSSRLTPVKCLLFVQSVVTIVLFQPDNTLQETPDLIIFLPEI